LSGTAPNLVYTPARDFNGSDSLQFSVADGYGSSNIATVTISVAAVNDPPVATPQTLAATEDTGRSITLEGSDIEGATLTFLVQSLPLHGTLSGVGATRTYTPQTNYHGPDSFTFRASDSATSSAPATVTIDVAAVEDLPVAQAVSRTVSEDNPSTVTLAGSDADGDPISFAITTAPAHGTLSGTAPALIYVPAANYNGPDSFTYTVSDGDDTSAPAPVTLQITPVNDDPVATNSSAVTAEDTPVTIPLQATDVDSATLTFSIRAFPADGLLSGTGPNLTYTPAPNTSGSRSFIFRAFDNLGGFDDATVTIQITPVNDPPTTADDFAFTEPGSPKTFGVIDNDIDIEGDSVQLDSVDAPAHGSVEIVDGKLVYTPEAGFTGVDIFAYTAIDSHGASSTGKAHVGVGTFPPGAPTEAIATIAGSITSTNLLRIPAISSDGRYITFTSSLPLVNDDTNGVEDVYLHDRGTGALTRISVATGGGQGNAESLRPHLSASGRYVVFDSLATNLVAGDTNGVLDVFRHDRMTGETIRVSVTTGGAQASGASFEPEISDDGNLVVFQSTAFDLIDSDSNGTFDIFVRDLAASTTTRVSVTATGGEGDLPATEPTISGDGRYVAFTSSATNLVAGDTNNLGDIFVRDLVASTTTRVSVSSIGGEANSTCSRASISQDGRFVSFRSAASNLVGGTPPPAQIIQLYVRNVQQQTTTLSGTSQSSILWGRLSADGRYATTFTSGGVLLRDRFAGFASTPPGASSWLWPMISGNGRYVVALDTSNGGRVIVTPNPL
jgi:Tol biopolymer transport system component